MSDKQAFISQYKFNVAFENSTYPGYSTEKLLQAMVAGTVPIYWGDPQIGRDFNTARFINANDFASTDAVIDKIRQLDEDDNAYAAMIAEPWFIGGEVPRWTTPDAILGRFDQFLADRRTPVAQRQRSPTVLGGRVADRWRKRQRYRTRVTEANETAAVRRYDQIRGPGHTFVQVVQQCLQRTDE